jgi:hypothetical protein
MTLDLTNLVDDNFYGEVTLTFQNGKIVLVKKVETFKFDLNKTIDLSAVVVLR